jgi:iron complex transport system substrate-binding protein
MRLWRRSVAVLLALFALAAALPASAQEMRSYTDDAGRVVDVPVAPKRIVSLHDSSLTVPLLELGVMPVGSFGRPGADGKVYMRGAATLTGVTFENSPIAYVGGSPADVEAIAALEPDLIITAAFNETPLEQLEKIAPTVVVEDNMRGEFVTFDRIADLTGTQDRLAVLKERYAGQIAQIREVIEGNDVTASILLTQNGQIAAWHTYGSLGKVLRDAGIHFPEIIDTIEGSDRVLFSGEQLPAFDADFIFATYDTPRGLTPQGARDELETVTPGYCQFLHACRSNQLILLPREDAVARSYTALGMMAEAVLVTLGGRDFTPIAR